MLGKVYWAKQDRVQSRYQLLVDQLMLRVVVLRVASICVRSIALHVWGVNLATRNLHLAKFLLRSMLCESLN